MNKALYENLYPDEFEAIIARKPIGYLPFGTLEWHGFHNVLGADMIIAEGLFIECAKRFGGIVFPPLWLAPDITRENDGAMLIGMDFFHETSPNKQLPGSCYWISDELFVLMIEAILAQAKRAGFKVIIADGHGPARNIWYKNVDRFETMFGIKLISAIRDFKQGEWKTQIDHAGKNETSLLMSINAEYSDLARLGAKLVGIIGENPRESSPEYGRALIEETVESIGEKLEELGFLSAWQI